MSEILVGVMSSVKQLTGDFSEKKQMGGSFDLYELPIDQYDGIYVVTPSEDTQVLPTQNTSLLGDVTVNQIPSQYVVPAGTLEITENGTKDVKAYANVDVDVPPTLQTKSATYTPSTSAQTDTVTADVWYDGLEEVDVTVSAIQTETKSATPTESAQTITPTSGNYLTEVTISTTSARSSQWSFST